MQFASSPRTRNESFWSEDHYHDENNTKNQVTNIAEGETRNVMDNDILEDKHCIGWIRGQSIKLRENKHVDSIDGECSNDYARNTADATNDHHGEENYRVTKAKVIRRNSAQLCSIIGTRDA